MRNARGRSHINDRLTPYRSTPEIRNEQFALINANFTRCERLAFTECADPRVDTESVVEDAFARLTADWMREVPDRAAQLDSLVRAYASQALRRVPDAWTPRDWRTPQYTKLFAEVASEEVMKGLQVIDTMASKAPQTCRIFEARRVYGHKVAVTAARLGISANSVGPGTKTAEVRIGKVTDLDTVLTFLTTQMGGEL